MNVPERLNGADNSSAYVPEKAEIQLGQVNIKVFTVKEPGSSWHGKFKELILKARLAYERSWGIIPLEDSFDEHSFIDLALTTYPLNGNLVTEGLTMRTIELGKLDHTLPDDLRYFIDANGTPLFDLITQRFYKGNYEEAKKKIVVASRIAGLRTPGNNTNRYTAQAFSAIQMLAASRAATNGVEYFFNTMRPDMDKKAFKLSDDYYFHHSQAEKTLDLQPHSICLNRNDPYVQHHLFHYPGYFNETAGLKSSLKALRNTNFDQILYSLGIDPNTIDTLRPSDMYKLVPLLTGMTTEAIELRKKIITDIKDGCSAYLMTTQERFREGEKIIQMSNNLFEQKQRAG